MSDTYMVTIPGGYDGPTINLTPSANYEIELKIGNEQVFPNALDLLDAVLRVALTVNPEGATESLQDALEALPCGCTGCKADRFKREREMARALRVGDGGRLR